MKIFKYGLRIWFAIASVFSFLVGWVFFAHSNKPAPLQIAQPTLSAPAPQISTLNFFDDRRSGLPSFSTSTQSSVPSFRPRLRSGGS